MCDGRRTVEAMEPAPTDTDRALAAALTTIPGVRAVLLGGSRATGTDDGASDTDLYALRRGPLSPEAVRAAVLAPFADHGTVTHDATWGVEDRLHIDGRLVEVMHFDLSEFGVDEAFDPGLDPNGYTTAFLHTLARGVPLADPHGELAALTSRLATYPEPTAQRILARTPTELASYLEQLTKAQDRADWPSVLHRRTALQTAWFDALFALNRAYHPGEKRLLDHADRLPVTVPDQRTRWEEVTLARGDDPNLIAQLRALVDDLLALAR